MFGGGNSSFSFGSAPAKPAATTTAPGGFSFGAPTTTTAPAATGGFGGFGSTPAATTAPATSGFGGFGAAATTAAPTTTAGFGGFGAKTATTTAAPAASGFGGFGGFGAKTTTTATAAAPASTALGGSLFGKPAPTTATATASAPGASTMLSPANIIESTKYSELPETARQQLDELEKYIQTEIHTCDFIRASSTPKTIKAITAETEELSHKLSGLKNLLERDTYLINDLKQMVGDEVKNAEIAFRFIDRSQSQYQKSYPHGSDETSHYFFELANKLEHRMQHYHQMIEDLERYLTSMSQQAQYTPQAIGDILKSQNESFLAIASQIAALHDSVSKQRTSYLNYRSRFFNDNRNLFLAAKKGYMPGQPGEKKLNSLSEIAASAVPKPSTNTTTTQQQQPAAAGTSLFGAGATNPGTSLFGKSTTTGGSNLFGKPTATTTTGTGLFGASTATTTAPAASGGLFGKTATAPAAGGSLFGSTATTTAAPAANGGLFGSSATTTPAAGGGLFGKRTADAPATQPATTGGFSFGAPANKSAKKPNLSISVGK